MYLPFILLDITLSMPFILLDITLLNVKTSQLSASH